MNKNVPFRLLRTALHVLVALSVLTCGFSVAQTSSGNDTAKIREALLQKERALANAERQHDSSVFKRLLRNDVIYVAFNGWVFTKSELISKMSYINVQQYDPENTKIRLPASDIALITYDLKAKANIAGHDLPKKQYVSSVWVKRGGRWQLLFHQATPDTHP